MLERLDKRPYFLAAGVTLFCAVALIALALFLAMGDEAGARPGGAETPPYEVLSAHDALDTRAVMVATPEKGEAGMRLIADDLRDENLADGGTLLVEFQGKASALPTGFALVFDDEDAVLDTGDSDRFGEVYDEDDAERIIEEEDGIRAVSFREFSEEHPSIWEKAKSFLR